MSGKLKSFVSAYPIATFIIGCLLPVHLVLWTLIGLGVSREMLVPLKLPFALLPSLSGFLITYVIAGEVGVQRLWRRLFLKNSSLWLYISAVLGFLLLALIALYIRTLYDGYNPQITDYASFGEFLLISPFLLLFPGFAEEFGWRGFMQHRLQLKINWFFASVIVGFIWGSWHTMDFIMGNWSYSFEVLLIFFAYIIGSSVIIGYLYQKSKGSIAIAILAHFGANCVNFFLPVWKQDAGWETAIIFISMLWVVGILMALIHPISLNKANTWL